MPPPRVPARPSRLKEQGSDLCVVLEGRLRSFSTWASLVKGGVPGGKSFLDVWSVGTAQDRGSALPGCVLGVEGWGFLWGWAWGSPRGYLELLLLLLNWEGEPQGEGRKIVWFELGTGMRQDVSKDKCKWNK